MNVNIDRTSCDLDKVDVIRHTVEAAREVLARRPGIDQWEESQLTREAQLGDELAMLELIVRHAPRLRALAAEAHVSNGAPLPDLHQAALTGFMLAVAAFDPDGDGELFTTAYPHIRLELTETNRAVSPVPVARATHQRFFAAMRAADNDPEVARRWTQLQRLSIAELEPIAEDPGNRDAQLAREIVDERVDRYELYVRRGYMPDGRGGRKPVPDWEEYRTQRGRGLTGAEFDVIHQAVTYCVSTSYQLGDSSAAPGGAEPDPEDDRPDRGVANVADPLTADLFLAVEDRLTLPRVLDVLEGREAKVIAGYLEGMTDRQMAEALGLSRTRIIQIRQEAIARMRRAAKA